MEFFLVSIIYIARSRLQCYDFDVDIPIGKQQNYIYLSGSSEVRISSTR